MNKEDKLQVLLDLVCCIKFLFYWHISIRRQRAPGNRQLRDKSTKIFELHLRYRCLLQECHIDEHPFVLLLQTLASFTQHFLWREWRAKIRYLNIKEDHLFAKCASSCLISTKSHDKKSKGYLGSGPRIYCCLWSIIIELSPSHLFNFNTKD